MFTASVLQPTSDAVVNVVPLWLQYRRYNCLHRKWCTIHV